MLGRMGEGSPRAEPGCLTRCVRPSEFATTVIGPSNLGGPEVSASGVTLRALISSSLPRSRHPMKTLGLDDGRTRCPWSNTGLSEAYVRYHDEEWGVPVRDDRTQFEFLIL